MILISCIPMLLGSAISMSISKSTALNEITTTAAVMNEKINNNKELFLSLLAESEKRKTEQYQYLVKETDEIKEQLKQKKSISMNGNELEVNPDAIFLSTRGCPHQSKWLDSLNKYIEVNDSLYSTICWNLKVISQNLPQTMYSQYLTP